MTKVQAQCIKIAAKKGNIELVTKLALLANLENGNEVFINNARSDAQKVGITAHQFAGGLSALTAKGFYVPSDDPEYKGWFGYVTVKQEQE